MDCPQALEHGYKRQAPWERRAYFFFPVPVTRRNSVPIRSSVVGFFGPAALGLALAFAGAAGGGDFFFLVFGFGGAGFFMPQA